MKGQIVEVGKDHRFEDQDIKCVIHASCSHLISIQFNERIQGCKPHGNIFLSKKDIQVLAEHFGFILTEKREELIK